MVFFHYDPSYDDEKLNRIKEEYKNKDMNSVFSYEGLEINLL